MLFQTLSFLRTKKPFHFWTSAWLFYSGINGIFYYLFYTHKLTSNLSFLFFDFYLFFWLSQYFMVVTLIEPNFKFKKIHILLFIPALLGEIRLYFLRIDPVIANSFVDYLYQKDSMFQIPDPFFNFLMFFNLFFCISGFVLYLANKLNWKEIQKNYKEGGIIRKIIKIMIALALVDFILNLTAIYHNFFHKITTIFDYAILFYIAKDIVINLFLQFAYFFIYDLVSPENNSENLLQNFVRNPLDNINIPELEAKIMQLLEKDEIFLDENLNLRSFAQKTGYHYAVVSQYINQKKKIRFNDLITQYRIKKAIELMNTKPELNSTQLGFESGFNSVPSFYRLFKKYTGKSPDYYRKTS